MRHGRVAWPVGFAAVALLGLGVVADANLDPTVKPKVAPPTRVIPSETPYRAFTADSWWNTPLPDDPPGNSYEAEILDYLSSGDESGGGCLTLAGAGDSPWGHPIYWAKPGDPVYDVEEIDVTRRPPELEHLRVPIGAQPAANNDGTMTIFDRDKGYVTALTNASYDADKDEWSTAGATVTYLNSNGLSAEVSGADDPRNVGTHRGNNGATMAVRWDMVRAGAIPHVLKIAAGPEVADRAVFPMAGSDGDYHGSDPSVPPQGLRMRIDPAINLNELNLHPEALVIARALQRYGVYIGDSGGATALKLENTVVEGLGHRWGVTSTDLCSLPFDPEYWDVLAEGYDPAEQ
jgi:hypothetical protein